MLFILLNVISWINVGTRLLLIILQDLEFYSDYSDSDRSFVILLPTLALYHIYPKMGAQPHSMASYVSRCGHVLNNPLVLYFTVFVSRIVTKLLSLYHRSHCASRCAVPSRVPVHRGTITQLVSVALDFLSISMHYKVFVYLFVLLVRRCRTVKVFVAYETSQLYIVWEVINARHVLSNISSFELTRSISYYAPVGSGEIGIRLVGFSKGTADEAGAPKRISCDMPIYIT